MTAIKDITLQYRHTQKYVSATYFLFLKFSKTSHGLLQQKKLFSCHGDGDRDHACLLFKEQRYLSSFRNRRALKSLFFNCKISVHICLVILK